MRVKINRTCSQCGGSGEYYSESMARDHTIKKGIECPACKGTGGIVTIRGYTSVKDMIDYIPLDKCINGYIYELRSRNLLAGVYSEVKQGFIGLRTKFSFKFLEVEYHWDIEMPHGTVKPIRRLEKLPDDIDIHEHKRDIKIATELYAERGKDWIPVIRRDVSDNNKHGSRMGFEDRWADTGERLPDNEYPRLLANEKLYGYMEKLEEKYNLGHKETENSN